jgi:hypothetical protein
MQPREPNGARPPVPTGQPWREGCLPPHNVEAEIDVLGSMVLDAGVAGRVILLLRPEHFYFARHAHVFSALVTMVSGAQPIDIFLLGEELRRRGLLERIGGTSFLSEVMASCPTAANGDHYARVVLDRWRDREECLGAQELRDARHAHDEAGAEQALARIDAARADRLRAATGDVEVFALAQLLAADLPEPEALLDTWFARGGVNGVIGPSGSGKSWLLWALALALALPVGGEILGELVRTGPRRVLIVLGSEDPPRRAKARFKKLLASAAVKLRPEDIALRIARPPRAVGGLDTPAGLAWLRAQITEWKATVVVLDTVSSLVTLETSNGQAVRAFMTALHRIRDDFQADVFLSFHTRKPSNDPRGRNPQKTADDLLGATEWRTLSDGLVLLDPEDDRAERVWVRRVKDKDLGDEPRHLLVGLDRETGRLDVVTDVGEERRSGPRPKATYDDFIRALPPTGSWITTSALQDRVGLKKTALKKHMASWLEQAGGDVDVRPGSGPHGENSYRLVPKDAAVDAPGQRRAL